MERRSVVVSSILAAVIVVATDLLYVALIAGQGGSRSGSKVPFFVSGYLALMATMIVLATAPMSELNPFRVPLRAAAAGGLLVLGLMVGYPGAVLLVGAGLLVGFALTRTNVRPAQWWVGVVAVLVSLAVLIAGFQLTEGLFF